MEPEIKKLLLQAQKAEITEHLVYKKLASSIKDKNNKKVLERISQDELKHYNIWKGHTQQDVNPSIFKLGGYYLISKIFGLTFGLKLMEQGEERAQKNYKKISKHMKSHAEKIEKDEKEHERQLLNLLDEEKLKYVGSIVLGLNDALVELTGALAGFTLALQDPKLIATAGLITGIAASLSMTASEYLSTKSDAGKEEKDKIGRHPLKAAIYTGIAYIFTVLFLIFPYLIVNNIYGSLIWMMANAIIVILFFTYYISVAKEINFKKEFLTMAIISFSVALISFGIGYLIRLLLGVDV